MPRREGDEGADPIEPETDGSVTLPVEDHIDLHAFDPRDVPEVVSAYLESAQREGLREVRVIHGRGKGVQKERVRRLLARDARVAHFEQAPAERGGWGATVVFLKPSTGRGASANISVARSRAPNLRATARLARHEARERKFLALLALVGTAAIAYADVLVARTSLGLLYLLPITLMSLTGQPRLSYPLAALCLILREALGPFGGGALEAIGRGLLAGTAYGFVAWWMVRRAGQRLELIIRSEAQRSELEHEMELAAETQRQLLPEAPPAPSRFDFAGRMAPARIVGGDYFGYFAPRAGAASVAIGDVSGKGVGAGMFMPALATAIRMALADGASPRKVVERVDEAILAAARQSRYATLFYVELDDEDRSLTFANAGHPPPLLFRPRERRGTWLEAGGPPVGIMPGSEYEQRRETFDDGDILVLYTDGLSEARYPNGNFVGQKPLLDWVRDCSELDAPEILTRIEEALARATGGVQLEDDCTLVVVKRLSRARS